MHLVKAALIGTETHNFSVQHNLMKVTVNTSKTLKLTNLNAEKPNKMYKYAYVFLRFRAEANQ